jgi:hypothetical protein
MVRLRARRSGDLDVIACLGANPAEGRGEEAAGLGEDSPRLGGREAGSPEQMKKAHS